MASVVAEFVDTEGPFVRGDALLFLWFKICNHVIGDVLAAIMITLTRLHIISDAHRRVVILRNLVNFDRQLSIL